MPICIDIESGASSLNLQRGSRSVITWSTFLLTDLSNRLVPSSNVNFFNVARQSLPAQCYVLRFGEQ